MPSVRAELIISAQNQASSALQSVAADTRAVATATTDSANAASSGGPSITDFYSAIRIGEMALRTLKGAYDSIIDPSAREQSIQFQTAAVLKSTGDASGYTATQIKTMTSAMAESNGVNLQSLETGANMLLTFRQIGHDVFPQALQAAQDLSIAMGQDLRTSIIQVGKAMDDPARGLTALRRIGVTFTQDQADVIKAMVKTGDVAGAQAVILKELNTEFGGSGAANVKTYSGQITLLGNALTNLKTDTGSQVLPGLTQLAKDMTAGLDVQHLLTQAQQDGISVTNIAGTTYGKTGVVVTNYAEAERDLTNKLALHAIQAVAVNDASDRSARSIGLVSDASDRATTRADTLTSATTNTVAAYQNLTGAALDHAITLQKVDVEAGKVEDALLALQTNTDPKKVESLTLAWMNQVSAFDKAKKAAEALSNLDLVKAIGANDPSQIMRLGPAYADAAAGLDKLRDAEQQVIDKQWAANSMATTKLALSGAVTKAEETYQASYTTTALSISKITDELAKYQDAQGTTSDITKKGQYTQEDYAIAVDRAQHAQDALNIALAGTVDKHGKVHQATQYTLDGLQIAAESAQNTVDKMAGKMQTSEQVTADYTKKILDLNNQLDALRAKQEAARDALQKTDAQVILNSTSMDKLTGKELADVSSALGLMTSKDYEFALSLQAVRDKFDLNHDGMVNGIEITPAYLAALKSVRDVLDQVNSQPAPFINFPEAVPPAVGAVHTVEATLATFPEAAQPTIDAGYDIAKGFDAANKSANSIPGAVHTASAGLNNFPEATKPFSDYLNNFPESVKNKIIGPLDAATAAAGLFQGSLDRLHDKTVTVTANYFDNTYTSHTTTDYFHGTRPDGSTYAQGGNFIVPPGYPNDSYPMRVQSGEHVTVTPAGQSGAGGADVAAFMREMRMMIGNLPRAIRDGMRLQ